MEENTSKVLVARDANVASAALLNTNAGAGTSLFVINLCASMAPIANVAKALPGFESYRLYQVTRREDGRTRYRLRLGFFTTEADAEAVLSAVRTDYPTAFTTCLIDEDRKFARGFVPEPSSAPKPTEAPKIAVVVDNTPALRAEPAKNSAPAKAAPVAKPATNTVAKAPTKAEPKTDTVTVKAVSSAPATTPKTDTVTVKALSTASQPKTDTVTVRALKDAKPAPKSDAVPPQALATGKFNATAPASKPSVTVPAEALATGRFKAAAPTAKNEPAAAPQALATGKFAASSPAKVESKVAAAPSAVDEIELSWDPPALSVPSGATTVTASAPTQDVIKAPAPPKAPTPPAAAAAAAKPAAKTVEAPAKKPTIEAPSKLLADIELSLEAEPAAIAPKETPTAKPDEPFRVGKGIDIPTTSLTLEAAAPAPAAQMKTAPATVAATASAKPTVATPAAPAPAKPAADASKMKAAQAAAPETIKAAVSPTIRKLDGPLPDLDSTQTIRALTNDELNDDSQEKWFAIQLAVSEQPVNLDAMPRLDIFEAYRLYSVASAGSGKITHALRLGFFREDHSAEAVSGYLKTFFNSPTVVRISIAEQARFKDAPVAKPAAKTEAKVLDLSQARDRAPKVIPTVTMEVDTKKFDPLATGSFKATSATGTHKALATGSHPALNATGTHKALATGAHKALKPAAKSATPPTKRSQPLQKSMMTGKHKAYQPKKSLSEQLLDEAREVELSQSGIRKLPKNESLFSKMFGKKK